MTEASSFGLEAAEVVVVEVTGSSILHPQAVQNFVALRVEHLGHFFSEDDVEAEVEGVDIVALVGVVVVGLEVVVELEEVGVSTGLEGEAGVTVVVLTGAGILVDGGLDLLPFEDEVKVEDTVEVDD